MNTPTETVAAVAVTETVAAAPAARRGVAPRPLAWPDGEFSVSDALAANNNIIKKPAMATRIKAAVNSGELVLLSATRPVPNKGAGRPAFLFRKA